MWRKGVWLTMKTNTIITIGREYGSAGREIGYKVADAFGIKLYDKGDACKGSERRAVSAKRFLKIMMKNRRTVFSTRL